MIDQPKTITGPDGQTLREQTLAEFVMILPEGHLARRELAELQRRSSEMFRLSRENSELKTQLEVQAVGPIPEISSAAEIPMEDNPVVPLPTTQKVGFKPEPVRMPCRFCGKEIALGKGYWATHLRHSHPELNATDSPQIEK